MTTNMTSMGRHETALVFVERRKQPLTECVRAAVERYLTDLDGHPTGDLHQLVMGEVEKPLLETVLRHVGGNQTQTAQLLGMNRGTLRKKLADYGIE